MTATNKDIVLAKEARNLREQSDGVISQDDHRYMLESFCDELLLALAPNKDVDLKSEKGPRDYLDNLNIKKAVESFRKNLPVLFPKKDIASEQDLKLLSLAKKENFKKVISILDDDCYNNINASDAEGYTLLYYAIEGNDIPLIEKLIEKNVDLNYTPPALFMKRHEINNQEIRALLFKNGRMKVDIKGRTLISDFIL